MRHTWEVRSGGRVESCGTSTVAGFRVPIYDDPRMGFFSLGNKSIKKPRSHGPELGWSRAERRVPDDNGPGTR